MSKGEAVNNDIMQIYIGHVYKITNNVNGKVYIGETIRGIKKRFKDHCVDAFANNSHQSFHFYRAIRKYGIDSFSIEELQEVSHIDRKKVKELILKLEEEYILKYDSFNNGYNSNTGGRHPLEVSTKTRELQSTIKKENPNTYINIAIAKQKSIESRIKGIICYNYETGELINQFDSLAEGALFYNIDRSGICKVCKKTKNFLGKIGEIKLTWRYSNDPYSLDYKIKVYDELGNLLDKFINLKSAAKKHNIKCPETIQRCCDGIKNFTGRVHGERLVWRYINDNFKRDE